MRLAGTVYTNGKTIVFCVGDDITPDTKCSKFAVDGHVYEAIGSGVSNSISDVMQFGIVVRGKVDIVGEEITIIE